jgi:hypothetical protein
MGQFKTDESLFFAQNVWYLCLLFQSAIFNHRLGKNCQPRFGLGSTCSFSDGKNTAFLRKVTLSHVSEKNKGPESCGKNDSVTVFAVCGKN